MSRRVVGVAIYDPQSRRVSNGNKETLLARRDITSCPGLLLHLSYSSQKSQNHCTKQANHQHLQTICSSSILLWLSQSSTQLTGFIERCYLRTILPSLLFINTHQHPHLKMPGSITMWFPIMEKALRCQVSLPCLAFLPWLTPERQRQPGTPWPQMSDARFAMGQR